MSKFNAFVSKILSETVSGNTASTALTTGFIAGTIAGQLGNNDSAYNAGDGRYVTTKNILGAKKILSKTRNKGKISSKSKYKFPIQRRPF